MQFMSQAIGLADCVILAMAPLGIITIIVSAIRVGGPTFLKAIIGRARENLSIPEMELMSSTSEEACELWNGRNVVRCQGSGEIWQFICLVPKGLQARQRKSNNDTQTINSEFNATEKQKNLEASKEQDSAAAGNGNERPPSVRFMELTEAIDKNRKLLNEIGTSYASLGNCSGLISVDITDWAKLMSWLSPKLSSESRSGVTRDAELGQTRTDQDTTSVEELTTSSTAPRK